MYHSDNRSLLVHNTMKNLPKISTLILWKTIKDAMSALAVVLSVPYTSSALAQEGGAHGQGHPVYQWQCKCQDAGTPNLKALLLNTILSLLELHFRAESLVQAQLQQHSSVKHLWSPCLGEHTVLTGNLGISSWYSLTLGNTSKPLPDWTWSSVVESGEGAGCSTQNFHWKLRNWAEWLSEHIFTTVTHSSVRRCFTPCCGFDLFPWWCTVPNLVTWKMQWDI